MKGRFAISATTGGAAEFHARPLPEVARPEVWVHDTVGAALALGSAQRIADADQAECAAQGVDVLRRRSGGGAVLLEPGAVVWIDVIVPRDDEAWLDDIGRSMTWMGRRWREALLAVIPELAGRLDVHDRAPLVTPWSSLVCFAAIGRGEVALDGHKLVGISQRRTRQGARFQCALHRRWNPARLVRLLAPPRPGPDDLPGVATLPDADPRALAQALAESMST